MPREKMSSNVSMVQNQNWKDCTKRAIYTAAIGAAGGYFLLGETGESSLFSKQVMSSTAVGVGCGVGSLIADNITPSIVNSIDSNYQMRQVESGLLKDSICGLGTLASLKVMSGIDPSIVGFLTGGVSKFLGDSVYNAYDPALLGMLF